MPAWALKLGSVCVTLLVLASSYGYARTHVKNPSAPLNLAPGVQVTALPAITFTHVS